MADALILYRDLLVGATMTATTARASLPVANIAHPHVRRVMRCAGASVVIDIDCGSARTAHGVALAGLGDAAFTGLSTFAVTAGATQGASAALSLDATAPAAHAGISVTDRTAFAAFGGPISARWWRLSLTATGVTDIEVGRVLLGEAFAASVNIGYPLSVRHRANSRIVDSYGNQRVVDRRATQREIAFGWSDAGATEADIAAMLAFDRIVADAEQVAVIPDPASAALGFCVVGSLMELGEASFSGVGVRSKSYRLLEAAI